MPEAVTGPGRAAHYRQFLQSTAPGQPRPLAHYDLEGEQVWLKKAGARNARWPYWVLGALARAARLPLLRPVPNLGGALSIHTEARRLGALTALGLRVPAVLAEGPEGLLIGHLAAPGQDTPSLAVEMHAATAQPPQTMLRLFAEGLDALAIAHDAGACLSQAFARNLVRCPDGTVAYVDFEDDPAAVLPLAQCQARDVLCYLHSAALHLHEAAAFDAARPRFARWLAQRPPEVQALVATAVQRLRLLRRLPADRRWGRDLLRARMAWALAAPVA